ncbi:MAG: maleylpyruvate isomerase N-terminal domain-containing protein [Chloroflexi bacterium]|nr:maleylpyruvate isomerase N-terminal domain-containing protein [Chloroflexota bacterium]
MNGAGQPPTALTRDQAIALLVPTARLVEGRVRPDGSYEGWSGREVLIHLAVYARVVGALLQAAAEARQPTAAELFGRELSAEELRLGLDEQNALAQQEYAALDFAQALTFWRSMHARVMAQLGRLTDAQLAAAGPTYPPTWTRAHLFDVAIALAEHYQAHMAGEP